MAEIPPHDVPPQDAIMAASNCVSMWQLLQLGKLARRILNSVEPLRKPFDNGDTLNLNLEIDAGTSDPVKRTAGEVTFTPLKEGHPARASPCLASCRLPLLVSPASIRFLNRRLPSVTTILTGWTRLYATKQHRVGACRSSFHFCACSASILCSGL